MTQGTTSEGAAAIVADPAAAVAEVPATGVAEQAPPVTPDFIPEGKADASGIPADVLLADIYLPDDLKNDPSVKTLKTVTDLANRMVSSERMVGQDKFLVPGKDATEQQWNDIYNKLGRPEDASKYELKSSPDIPDGLIDGELVNAFAQKAHELGNNSKQANEMFAWYESVVTKQKAALDAAKAVEAEGTIEMLQKEYGNAFDSKIRLANSVFKNTKNGEEAMEAIKSQGLENNPEIVKWLVNLGASLGEDRMLGLSSGAASVSRYNTPEQAQAKLKEAMADPAYSNQYHGGSDLAHKALMEKVKGLMLDAAPG